jgi:hypothetical protein
MDVALTIRRFNRGRDPERLAGNLLSVHSSIHTGVIFASIIEPTASNLAWLGNRVNLTSIRLNGIMKTRN